MENIFIFKNGDFVSAKIEKMFGTHGPYLIEGKRLDCLVKVHLLTDSSTSTTRNIGTTVEKSNTGSLVGRSIAGAIVAGGAGAVIGGLSGKKESVNNTETQEVKDTDLTVELNFQDNSSLYLRVKNINDFHWLLGFVNETPLTDDEISIEKEKANKTKEYNQKIEEANRKNNLDKKGYGGGLSWLFGLLFLVGSILNKNFLLFFFIINIYTNFTKIFL